MAEPHIPVLSRAVLLARNAAFHLVALAVSGVFAVIVPLLLVPGPHFQAIYSAYLRTILVLLRWICGTSYEIRGHMPDGPVLFASAHQSTWENLFFPVLLGDPALWIKDEIYGFPLVGWVVGKKGYIRAYRTGDIDGIRNSLADSVRQSTEGRHILIFPTGTRTGTGPMPEFKRGVSALYERLKVPCVPVAHNSGRFWKNGSWLRYPGVVVVELMEPIPPGLSKKEFLGRLTGALTEGSDRLLATTGNPLLMPELSERADALSARIGSST